MLRWAQFEDRWLTKALMKPSARKKRDYVFSVFHQLNLKDAASYVAEVSPGRDRGQRGRRQSADL